MPSLLILDPEVKPSDSTICPDADLIYQAFMQLLPRGVAWDNVEVIRDRPSTIRKFMYALAAVWEKFEDDQCAALNEWFCLTANVDLDAWKADFGIPDECDLFNADLCAKVAAAAGASPSAEYLMGLLEANGYVGEGRWLTGDDPEFPGVRSTFYVEVDTVVSPAFAPGATLPFPLGEGHGLDEGGGELSEVQCMLERYVPAHCVVDVEQAVPLAGGALMLENETDGFAFDFGTLDLSKAVAKKIGGIDVSYHPDDFFANETTTAKLVLNALGVYEWAPHNLFLNSAAPATQSLTVLNGETYTLSVVGSGSVTVSVGGAGVATAGAPLTFTTTTTSITCTVAGTLTRIQLNRGHIATAYLATTSAARFGIPLEFRSSRRLLLSEPTLIARGLHTRNLANVAWIKTNMTATRTSVGVDDMPNGANRLTATAANATVTQAVTHAAADRYLSMFMRRITGTGAVQMTVNGGTNWTTVTSVQTIANGWERVTIPMLNVVNPNIGIRLVTSGDAIDVDMVQLDVSAFAPTSPTPSFSAAGSRAADKIYCELSSIPALGVAWSLYVVGVEYYGVPTGALYFMAISDSTTNEYVTLYAAAIGTLNTSIVDGGVAQVSITVAGARASATMQRYAMRVEANNVGASFNGAAPGVDMAATLPTVTRVYLGATSAGAVTVPAWVSRGMVLPRPMDDAELQELSGTAV